MMRKILMLALGAALLPAMAWAGDAKLGDVLIGQPWARASAGQAVNGAVYLTLTNSGKETERLVAASSPVAGTVELHNHVVDNGVMKMRQVDGVDVEPGAPIEFKPGGLHVMLIGLKAPLKQGDSFPLTLTFQRGGAVNVDVAVSGAGAMGAMTPMSMPMQASPHDGHRHAQ